jgi:hypothetical protein
MQENQRFSRLRYLEVISPIASGGVSQTEPPAREASRIISAAGNDFSLASDSISV